MVFSIFKNLRKLLYKSYVCTNPKNTKPKFTKISSWKKVSNDGPYEILKKEETKNTLIRNILSINGVTGIFLGEDFLSVNKSETKNWEDMQHIIISYINEFYAEGNTYIIDKSTNKQTVENLDEIEKKLCTYLKQK